jgi:hypothetical protein
MTTTASLWAKAQLGALRALCVSLIAFNSLTNRHRMSHQNGIVARGRVRIVDDLAIPDTTSSGLAVNSPVACATQRSRSWTTPRWSCAAHRSSSPMPTSRARSIS